MFMCVVNLKSVNKLDFTWKQSFLILSYGRNFYNIGPSLSYWYAKVRLDSLCAD